MWKKLRSAKMKAKRFNLKYDEDRWVEVRKYILYRRKKKEIENKSKAQIIKTMAVE